MAQKLFLVLFLISSLAWTQMRIGQTEVPLNVRQYLELSEAQTRSINEFNRTYFTFILSKLQRQSVVQTEIFTETAKTPVDPMALGLRYLEIEAIQREIRAEQTKTVAAVQNVLNPAQKTRLTSLEEVVRLQSTACNAQTANLLAQRTPLPGNIFPATPILSFSAVSLIGTCGSISGAARTGDFAFNPNFPPIVP